MPGDGTRTAITTNRPSARCLDLTRLISRVGRGPMTGVDRVEFAYLRHLCSDHIPLFLLAKTAFGYVLLDRSGAREILPRLAGELSWGKADVLGHLTRRASPGRRRAEADLRRLCIDRCLRSGLARMLRRSLPKGCAYLNVGHSNLSERVLRAWRSAGARIGVLIHDTIPLDFPQYQRPATPAVFKDKLRHVARYADLVICNSRQTAGDIARWGVRTDMIVAHLGVDVPDWRPQDLPDDIDLTRPYFLVLGTIEPRKNHTMLLDIWESLAEERSADAIPNLIIAGSRGWENEDVFHRLDTSPVMGRTVFERAGLGDRQIAALIAGAAGVLFPSRAEGYGLPAAEAMSLGTPVICANLPVYREFLGNNPVYLGCDDVYLWKQSILRLADEKWAGRTEISESLSETGIPTWTDHFNLVLKVT